VALEKMAIEANPKNKIEEAIRLFGQLNVQVDANELKEKYQNEAFDHLDKVKLSEAKKNEIKSFALSLLARKF
jgi:geranylgeranyl pyrophosphate synthase